MHATTLELELFVCGTLGPERGRALEQHCESCERCASAVAREARLEVALRSIAAERRCGTSADDAALEPLPAEPPAAPVSRGRFWAAAAALCLLLGVMAVRPPELDARPRVPAGVLLADAGDLARTKSLSPRAADEALSGGTP